MDAPPVSPIECEVWKKKQALMGNLRACKTGSEGSKEARRMIDRCRAFIGTGSGRVCQAGGVPPRWCKVVPRRGSTRQAIRPRASERALCSRSRFTHHALDIRVRQAMATARGRVAPHPQRRSPAWTATPRSTASPERIPVALAPSRSVVGSRRDGGTETSSLFPFFRSSVRAPHLRGARRAGRPGTNTAWLSNHDAVRRPASHRNTAMESTS